MTVPRRFLRPPCAEYVPYLDFASCQATQVIDLQGRLATPGFNDVHGHLSPDWIGRTLEFGGVEPAWEDVLRIFEEAVRTEPTGTVLSGAMGARVFIDPTCTPAKLTEIAAEHPVMLTTWTPLAPILNHAMVERLGIDEGAPPSRRRDGGSSHPSS